jgi:hypothetical protein
LNLAAAASRKRRREVSCMGWRGDRVTLCKILQSLLWPWVFSARAREYSRSNNAFIGCHNHDDTFLSVHHCNQSKPAPNAGWEASKCQQCRSRLRHTTAAAARVRAAGTAVAPLVTRRGTRARRAIGRAPQTPSRAAAPEVTPDFTPLCSAAACSMSSTAFNTSDFSQNV